MWEYIQITERELSGFTLNDFGMDGWELISIHKGFSQFWHETLTVNGKTARFNSSVGHSSNDNVYTFKRLVLIGGTQTNHD